MTTSQTPRMTILLVEDEPALRSVVARGLDRAGYRVIEATDALEALDLLGGAIAVDLIVTDVRMPRMDGNVFAVTVRRHHGDMPILMMSAFAAPASLPVGARFLAKPFTLGDLIADVRVLLRGSGAHD